MRTAFKALAFALVGILSTAVAAPVRTGSDNANKSSAVALKEGAEGSSYDMRIQTEGGLAPLKWRLVEGELPPGISLLADGTLRGTPEAAKAAPYVFTVEVSDSSDPPQSYTQAFQLSVRAAPLRIVNGNRLRITTPAAAPVKTVAASVAQPSRQPTSTPASADSSSIKVLIKEPITAGTASVSGFAPGASKVQVDVFKLAGEGPPVNPSVCPDSNSRRMIDRAVVTKSIDQDTGSFTATFQAKLDGKSWVGLTAFNGNTAGEESCAVVKEGPMPGLVVLQEPVLEGAPVISGFAPPDARDQDAKVQIVVFKIDEEGAMKAGIGWDSKRSVSAKGVIPPNGSDTYDAYAAAGSKARKALDPKVCPDANQRVILTEARQGIADKDTGAFSYSLKKPDPALEEGDYIAVSAINANGTGLESCYYVSNQTSWGRSRADFILGAVFSKADSDFSKSSVFLEFGMDSNFLKPSDYAQRLRSFYRRGDQTISHPGLTVLGNAFFNARFTASPTTGSTNMMTTNKMMSPSVSSAGARVSGADTGTQTTDINNFVSSTKAAEVQVGAYFPFYGQFMTWSYAHDKNAFFVGPVLKGGLITTVDKPPDSSTQMMTGTGTAVVSVDPCTVQTPTDAERLQCVIQKRSVFNYYTFGLRLGLLRLNPGKGRANDLISYFDITGGRWSNFDSVVQKPLGFAIDRPWRLGFEGRLKVPHLPIVIGAEGNYLGGAGTNDLRFFVGYKKDVGDLLNKLAPDNSGVSNTTVPPK